jgi:hypothetical protein
MKIQYAVVKPELCAEPGITVIAGIIISRLPYEEFASNTLIIDPDPSEGIVRMIYTGETHESRVDGTLEGHIPGGFQSLQFHEMITKKVFNMPKLNIPSADVTVVETDLPGTPAGHQAYVMFGLIHGTDNDLSVISEKVYQAELTATGSGVFNPMSVGTTKDTGIEAKHVMGNHLLNILTQPIWGFSDEKVGMSSLTTKSEFENIRKNREHMLEHGKNMPGVRSYLDPSTVDFLRAMNANGTTSPSHWQTQNERTERAQIAKKAWKASLVQDNGPTP